MEWTFTSSVSWYRKSVASYLQFAWSLIFEVHLPFKWFGCALKLWFNFWLTGGNSWRIEVESVPSLHGKGKLIQINVHFGINLWHSERLSSRRCFNQRCDNSIFNISWLLKLLSIKTRVFDLPFFLYASLQKSRNFLCSMSKSLRSAWRNGGNTTSITGVKWALPCRTMIETARIMLLIRSSESIKRWDFRLKCPDYEQNILPEPVLLTAFPHL